MRWKELSCAVLVWGEVYVCSVDGEVRRVRRDRSRASSLRRRYLVVLVLSETYRVMRVKELLEKAPREEFKYLELKLVSRGSQEGVTKCAANHLNRRRSHKHLQSHVEPHRTVKNPRNKNIRSFPMKLLQMQKS